MQIRAVYILYATSPSQEMILAPRGVGCNKIVRRRLQFHVNQPVQVQCITDFDLLAESQTSTAPLTRSSANSRSVHMLGTTITERDSSLLFCLVWEILSTANVITMCACKCAKHICGWQQTKMLGIDKRLQLCKGLLTFTEQACMPVSKWATRPQEPMLPRR